MDWKPAAWRFGHGMPFGEMAVKVSGPRSAPPPRTMRAPSWEIRRSSAPLRTRVPFGTSHHEPLMRSPLTVPTQHEGVLAARVLAEAVDGAVALAQVERAAVVAAVDPRQDGRARGRGWGRGRGGARGHGGRGAAGGGGRREDGQREGGCEDPGHGPTLSPSPRPPRPGAPRRASLASPDARGPAGMAGPRVGRDADRSVRRNVRSLPFRTPKSVRANARKWNVVPEGRPFTVAENVRAPDGASSVSAVDCP